MKLEEFKVQNFHSVVDSNIVNVSEITTLIGPNEAGKSGILQALASISMDGSYQLFDLTELNGVLKRYMDGELLAKDIEIIRAKFSLALADKEKLNAIIPAESEQGRSELEVAKYYDGFYKVTIDSKQYRIPSRYVATQALPRISQALQGLDERGKQHLQRGPNNQFASQFNSAMQKAGPLRTNVTSVEEVQGLLTDLEGVTRLGIDEPFKKEISTTLQTVNQVIKECYPDTAIERSLYEFLLEHMPRTVYFKTYERLEDEVPVSELKEKPQLHTTFVRFLTLAEIKLETLEKLTDEKMRQVYLQNGCGKASKLLRDAWHQEILDVELRYSSGRLMVFTKNSRAIETLLPPSAGSEGFQWYLGFYINFGAATNAEYRNAILLLDDPGVFLHPKGHKDLLALFDEYVQKDVTTIYSTHLPFLIPRNKLERLRLVQKESDTHSQVTEKFYTVGDKDILYPLRAALGITLADSLFIGESTIVLEGLSDRILIYGMLEEFKRRNLRKIIDIEKLEVLAGSGARGAKSYAMLLQIENLPYVVVLDNDDEGRGAKREFVKDGIPDERILVLNHCAAGGKKDFDTEDLFTSEVYAEAFYNVHGSKARLDKAEIQKRFSKGDMKFSNIGKELLKSAKVNYDLDKQAIAYELLRQVSNQAKLDENTTKNFGDLFDAISSEIKIYDS